MNSVVQSYKTFMFNTLQVLEEYVNIFFERDTKYNLNSANVLEDFVYLVV